MSRFAKRTIFLAIAVTILFVLTQPTWASEVFKGNCDECHHFGSSGGGWHNLHTALTCVSQGGDCNYCHSGEPLVRNHCNECHKGPGSANHHDCAEATSSCIECHTETPLPEEYDKTPCLEECTDNLDNDGDCLYDGDDVDCDIEICADGFDNDDDGLVDCADPDCLDVIAEVCNDGVDNDCDGLVDADDPECQGGTCLIGTALGF